MLKFKKIAFLFPGQGAQVVGMCKDFYQTYPEAKELFEEAENILERKITSWIFDGPEKELVETRNSQVALFVSSLAILAVMKKQFKDLEPAITAGLSLGEYTALVASNRLSFQKACPIVQYRADCMNEACLSTPGTMAAILGLKSDEVEELVKACHLPNDLWIANYNTPLQTVVSGTLKGIESAEAEAKAKRAKRFIRLNVHGAFHSGLMQSAEEKLRDKIASLDFHESTAGLVMNVAGDFVKENDKIRSLLIRQVTQSVRWSQGIQAMVQAGADLYLEIGAGKVLSGFNRQIGVTAPTLSINSVSDLETVAKTIY